MNCQNCDSKNVENYCPNCGQIKVVSKVYFSDIIKDLLGNVSNFESSFLKTLYFLLIKPRIIITDYLNGKRKTYFNPIKLLLLLLTIKTLLEVKVIENSKNISLSLSEEIISGDYWKLIFVCVFIPLFSLFSKFFFKKYNYSFAEYLIINAYIFSLLSLIAIVIYILKIVFIEKLDSGTILIVLNLIVLIWLNINIFYQSIAKTIIKTIIIYIISYSLIILPLIALEKLCS